MLSILQWPLKEFDPSKVKSNLLLPTDVANFLPVIDKILIGFLNSFRAFELLVAFFYLLLHVGELDNTGDLRGLGGGHLYELVKDACHYS